MRWATLRGCSIGNSLNEFANIRKSQTVFPLALGRRQRWPLLSVTPSPLTTNFLYTIASNHFVLFFRISSPNVVIGKASSYQTISIYFILCFSSWRISRVILLLESIYFYPLIANIWYFLILHISQSRYNKKQLCKIMCVGDWHKGHTHKWCSGWQCRMGISLALTSMHSF